MPALLERIEAHFRPDEVRRLEVPEWGEPAVLDGNGAVVTPAVPLIITYAPVTLDDQSFISQAASGDRHAMAAHLVALKACDENGKRLFQQIDAVTLRRKGDPTVITRISIQMLGGISVEQAAKN